MPPSSRWAVTVVSGLPRPCRRPSRTCTHGLRRAAARAYSDPCPLPPPSAASLPPCRPKPGPASPKLAPHPPKPASPPPQSASPPPKPAKPKPVPPRAKATAPHTKPAPQRVSIRAQLRLWDETVGRHLPRTPLMIAGPEGGGLSNDTTREDPTADIVTDLHDSDPFCAHSYPVGNPLDLHEDEVASTPADSPGDLVELRVGVSRLVMLAVYLGFFGGHHHFFLENGRWKFASTYKSFFSVPGYVPRSDIQPVIDSLPQQGTFQTYRALDAAVQGPSVLLGAPFLSRIDGFRVRMQEARHAHLDALLDVFGRVADPRSFRYLSLTEIAAAVLGPSHHGPIPSTTLFAIHTSLFDRTALFTPLVRDMTPGRLGYLFEIAPCSWQATIDRVRQQVLEHVERVAAYPTIPPPPSALTKFLQKARDVVLSSRRTRPHSPHGMVGPYAAAAAAAEPSVNPLPVPPVVWTADDRSFLDFLHIWSAYRRISHRSTINTSGSVILRLLDLYPDQDFVPSVGWTLLQELGCIKPWDLSTRYHYRLPHTDLDHHGNLIRSFPDPVEPSLRPDIARHRRTLVHQPVYAIDSLAAVDIDDALSLEPTDHPDQFWVHVHVADPAAVIDPHSDLARALDLVPSNVYLGPFTHFMFPHSAPDPVSDLGQRHPITDRHSLRPGAPCLTFSAKVNTRGDLLDVNIQPGTLSQVVYLDVDEVMAALPNQSQPPPPPTTILRVGGTAHTASSSASSSSSPSSSPASSRPNRQITALKPLLAQPAGQDLLTLHRLAHSLGRRRIQAGAPPFHIARPQCEVRLDEVTVLAGGHVRGDASITVSYGSPPCELVQETMVLAGEAAARWCRQRDVPIPYRTHLAPRSAPSRPASQARAAVASVYAVANPAPPLLTALSVSLGPVVFSTTPGPMPSMGLAAYARVTSPLRRFGDLLAHWQIHAALARDAAAAAATPTPTSVVPAPAPLPFDAAALAPRLAALRMRERLVALVERSAVEWTLQALVRAWRYGDTAAATPPLPSSFRFTVWAVSENVLAGLLDYFALPAILRLADLAGTARITRVDQGHVFEVALLDILVSQRTVLVRALRYLGPVDAIAPPAAVH